MRTRLLTALCAAAALGFPFLAPATAQAETDCSVVDTSPNQVVIGLKPVTVQFDVATDCDDEDHAMKWIVTGANYPTSNVYWFGACTYAYQTDTNSPTCPNGRAKLDVIGKGTFQGKAMAGVQALHASAFDDVNANDLDDDDTRTDILDTSFTLLRRTTWGTTFNASPEPRRKGQNLNITGQVSRANWDTGKYEKFGVYVKLQFRGEKEESYHTVRTVWDNGASASTTIKAVRSGYLRYYFPGDSLHAPSASRADYVKVLPKKKG
jgi:hypothetical protein